MRHRVYLLLVIVFGVDPLAAAEPIEIDTGLIVRRLTVVDGRLTTSALLNRSSGAEIALGPSDEFAIQLFDGPLLTASDYRVVDRQTVADKTQRRERFSLAPKDSTHPRVEVEYLARTGDHFGRKRLHMDGDKTVDWVAVEALDVSERGRMGGFGQPVYFGAGWFAGLEYPAGTNELRFSKREMPASSDNTNTRPPVGGTTNKYSQRLTCIHHPGRAKFTSQWAVIGAAANHDASIEDEFQRYLDTVRRPPRAHLQYVGWFDRREREITPESMRQTFEQFRQKLLDPFGLAFDAFVIDDGYQQPRSIWQCNDLWPDEFAPFAKQLETSGSRLGLWLPLNGYGLDTAWGGKQGFERSNHRKRYYCLAGQNYNQALRLAIERRIRDGNLSYLKHDFNFLKCSCDGHGHLPTDRHGLEANVDAQIELLAFERRLQPDILLNLTSSIWPSPWWLMHADTIWMGASDHGHDWNFSQAVDRQAEMTFRDGELHRLLRIQRAQVPASALMTHGIIRGRYAGIDPREDFKTWSDSLLMYFGRGTLLHELYLTPEQMPDEFWPPLGRAIAWARANVATLRHTRMIGGRPDDGEPYGYVHWSADKGIACLRNPSPRPATMMLSTVERPRHLPPHGQWHPAIVYPWRELRPPMHSGDQLLIALPSASVLVVELYAQLPAGLQSVRPGRFAVETNPPSDHSSNAVVELSLLAPLAGADVRPTAPPNDQKNSWSGSFQIEPSTLAQQRELVITCEPAGGAAIQVEPKQASLIDRMADPNQNDWEILRYRLDAKKSANVLLNAWLPPTPFWPQQSKWSAVLQTKMALSETDRKSVTASELPVWPLALDAGILTEEFVLVDGKRFERRRSTVEAIGWFLLLGIAPIAGGGWLLRRLCRQRHWAAKVALSTAVLVCLILLYTQTPLGPALARALQ